MLLVFKIMQYLEVLITDVALGPGLNVEMIPSQQMDPSSHNSLILALLDSVLLPTDCPS